MIEKIENKGGRVNPAMTSNFVNCRGVSGCGSMASIPFYMMQSFILYLISLECWLKCRKFRILQSSRSCCFL